MTKMHENEFDIDESLVRELLKSQCPHWAHLPLQTVPSSGTEMALFRLSQGYVARLPRIPGVEENIHKECEWLPQLSRMLGIPISEPLFKGIPQRDYPSYWTITKWNEGHNPPFEE